MHAFLTVKLVQMIKLLPNLYDPTISVQFDLLNAKFVAMLQYLFQDFSKDVQNFLLNLIVSIFVLSKIQENSFIKCLLK